MPLDAYIVVLALSFPPLFLSNSIPAYDIAVAEVRSQYTPEFAFVILTALTAMVAGSLRFTSALPFTDVVTAVPVPSELTIPIFLAVPQFVVVMFADPLKLVPLMVLVVFKVVAVAALPEQAPAVIELCATHVAAELRNDVPPCVPAGGAGA